MTEYIRDVTLSHIYLLKCSFARVNNNECVCRILSDFEAIRENILAKNDFDMIPVITTFLLPITQSSLCPIEFVLLNLKTLKKILSFIVHSSLDAFTKGNITQITMKTVVGAKTVSDGENGEFLIASLVELFGVVMNSHLLFSLSSQIICDSLQWCFCLYFDLKLNKWIRKRLEGILSDSMVVIFNNPSQFGDETDSQKSYDLRVPKRCTREILRFLISLIDVEDRNNDEIRIVFGLELITVVMNTPDLSSQTHLLSLIRFELTKKLIMLAGTNSLTLFSRSLILSFSLFYKLLPYLRIPFEIYIVKILERLNGGSCGLVANELVCELLCDLLKEDDIPLQIYINYDCVPNSPYLLESIIQALFKQVSAIGMSRGLASLRGLLTPLENIHKRTEHSVAETDFRLVRRNTADGTFGSGRITLGEDSIVSRLQLKKEIHECLRNFGESPRKCFERLAELGVLRDSEDSGEIACLISEYHEYLDITALGLFFGKQRNKEVLIAFLGRYDFSGLRMDSAIRKFLDDFHIPGEAPVIANILGHFVRRFMECNEGVFRCYDDAFLLANAIMVLNVDQHNSLLHMSNTPMSCQDFIESVSVQGDEGAPFKKMLKQIYTSVKMSEIVITSTREGTSRDKYIWNRKHSSREEDVFVETTGSICDREIFVLFWSSSVAALSYVYDKDISSATARAILDSYKKCAGIAAHFGMICIFDSITIGLFRMSLLLNDATNKAKFVELFAASEKAQEAGRICFELVTHYGDFMREGWKNVLEALLTLFTADIYPPSLLEADSLFETGKKRVLGRVFEDTRTARGSTGTLSSIMNFFGGRGPDTRNAVSKSREVVSGWRIELIISSTKSLHSQSLAELIKILCDCILDPSSLSSSMAPLLLYDVLVRAVINNRDRLSLFFPSLRTCVLHLVTSGLYPPAMTEEVIHGYLRMLLAFVNRHIIPYEMMSLMVCFSSLDLERAEFSRQSLLLAGFIGNFIQLHHSLLEASNGLPICVLLLELFTAGVSPPENLILRFHQKSVGFPDEDLAMWFDYDNMERIPIGSVRLTMLSFGVDLVEQFFNSSCLFSEVSRVESLVHLICCLNSASLKCASSPGQPESPTDFLSKVTLRLLDSISSVCLQLSSSERVRCNKWWFVLLSQLCLHTQDERKVIQLYSYDCLQKALAQDRLFTMGSVMWDRCFSLVIFPIFSRMLAQEGDEAVRIRAIAMLCKVFIRNVNFFAGCENFPPFWKKIVEMVCALSATSNESLRMGILEQFRSVLTIIKPMRLLSRCGLLDDTTDRLRQLTPELIPELVEEVTPVENTGEDCILYPPLPTLK